MCMSAGLDTRTCAVDAVLWAAPVAKLGLPTVQGFRTG